MQFLLQVAFHNHNYGWQIFGWSIGHPKESSEVLKQLHLSQTNATMKELRPVLRGAAKVYLAFFGFC